MRCRWRSATSRQPSPQRSRHSPRRDGRRSVRSEYRRRRSYKPTERPSLEGGAAPVNRRPATCRRSNRRRTTDCLPRYHGRSSLAITPDDATHRGVVGGYIDLDGITGDDADHSTLAHLAGRTGSDLMSRLELHSKRGIRERFGHNALRPEIVVLACDECLLSIRSRRIVRSDRAEDAIVVKDGPSRHSASEGIRVHIDHWGLEHLWAWRSAAGLRLLGSRRACSAKGQ